MSARFSSPLMVVGALLSLAVLFRVGLILLALTVLPLEHTFSMVHDDAYYYLDLARGLGSGQGSVFGGLLETNGYQPLWQWLLGGVSALLGNDRIALFHALILMPPVLLLLGVGLLLRVARGDALTAPILVAMTAGYLAFHFVLGMGMETALLLLVLPTLLYVIERRQLSMPALALFALLPLVRLDAAIVPAVHCLGMLLIAWRQRQSVSWRHAAILLLPVATLLLFAAYNELRFGLALPISGVVKSAGGPLFSNFPVLFEGVFRPYMWWLLLIWGGAEWLARGLPRDTRFLYAMAVFLLAALGQAVYYGLFSTWPLWPWYGYLSVCCVVAATCRLLYLLTLAWQARRWLAMLPAVLILSFAAAQAPRTAATSALQVWWQTLSSGAEQQPSRHAHLLDFNQRTLADMRAMMTGKVVAMGDRAGIVAYWRPENTRLIQTEGLMADLAFHQSRFSGHGEQYLAQHGVDLLITDRDHYHVEHTPAGRVFVVPEPVLGSMTTSGAMLFCFPEQAVVAEYSQDGLVRKRLFDFRLRQACEADTRRQFAAIEQGELGYMKHVFPVLADGGLLDRLGRAGRSLWR